MPWRRCVGNSSITVRQVVRKAEHGCAHAQEALAAHHSECGCVVVLTLEQCHCALQHQRGGGQAEAPVSWPGISADANQHCECEREAECSSEAAAKTQPVSSGTERRKRRAAGHRLQQETQEQAVMSWLSS